MKVHIGVQFLFIYLLVLPIVKRIHICARFGLGDKILVHSLANVEMTNVHKMKIFTWM
jgi:hypothetical protein